MRMIKRISCSVTTAVVCCVKKILCSTWENPSYLVVTFIPHGQDARERQICPHNTMLDVTLMPAELVSYHVVVMPKLGAAAESG